MHEEVTARRTEAVVVQWHLRLWVDVLQVPAEALAVQPLAQLLPGAGVAAVHLERLHVDREVEVLPLVQPDVREPRVVVVHDAAGAARKRVRRRLAEHVADVRAGRDLQRASAHPDLPAGKRRNRRRTQELVIRINRINRINLIF